MSASAQLGLNILNERLVKLKLEGQGTFGMVFSGKLNDLNVAIKEFFEDKLTPATQQELENELQIMTQINHPSIVKIYGYCPSPASLVLDFIQSSLFNLLHSDQQLE